MLFDVREIQSEVLLSETSLAFKKQCAAWIELKPVILENLKNKHPDRQRQRHVPAIGIFFTLYKSLLE